MKNLAEVECNWICEVKYNFSNFASGTSSAIAIWCAIVNAVEGGENIKEYAWAWLVKICIMLAGLLP